MFLLGFGGFGVFSAVKFIHGADNNEDGECDNKKVNDVLKKVTIGNMSNGIGAEDIGDVDCKCRKVEATSEEASDWHDDVVNEGFYDSGESATDGDTDSKVDDAATIDEFTEFFKEGAVFDFLKNRFVHDIYYNINKKKLIYH